MRYSSILSTFLITLAQAAPALNAEDTDQFDEVANLPNSEYPSNAAGLNDYTNLETSGTEIAEGQRFGEFTMPRGWPYTAPKAFTCATPKESASNEFCGYHHVVQGVDNYWVCERGLRRACFIGEPSSTENKICALTDHTTGGDLKTACVTFDGNSRPVTIDKTDGGIWQPIQTEEKKEDQPSFLHRLRCSFGGC